MLRELHQRLRHINRGLWMSRPGRLPRWKRRTVHVARLVVVLLRDVFKGDLTLWTMSLVYTTLLSMVPLLALSFSVLKAFGVHNQIEPLLHNLLAPLGAEGNAITSRLIGFVEHMNVGVLGAVGLALLLYTVISLMQKIEEAFNTIWHVTQLRSLGERFSRYLSALLVGPLLVFAALGITAMALSTQVAQRVLEIEPLGRLALGTAKLVPYALIIGAFTFLYVFVPNTRVRFVPALIAGVLGGLLWQTAGWAFATFVASSTRYAAIYSSFAILVMFLIWLYVSWLVLLTGASLSFYLQHPEYLYDLPGEPRLSNRMRERLALAVIYLVGSHFVHGRPPWNVHQLTQHLAVPMHAIDAVLGALVQGKVLNQSNENPPGYLPARDLAHMTVADVLTAVRKAGEARFLNPESLPLSRRVEDIVTRTETAIAAAAQGITVGALVDEAGGSE